MWSIFTRDKLGMGPLSLMQWSLFTRDKLGTGPLSLMQWSLFTRDKLGTGPLSFGERLSSLGGDNIISVVLGYMAREVVLLSEAPLYS